MTIQIITLIITLIAVIVGPIITYRITKKNLKFKYLSMFQGKWIEKLEESSHLFLNSTLEWIEKYRAIVDGTLQSKDPNIEIDRMLNAINSSIIRLQLLLDNKKRNEKEILDNVTSMKRIVNSKKFDAQSIKSIRENHDEIIELLKMIFQEERNKISKIFE